MQDHHHHSHNHDHHHHCKHSHIDKRADCLTNTAAIGELISSFISDGYWLATVFDIACGFEAKIGGLSYYALAFGIVLSALSASGAAYSHRVLNTQHQTSSPEDENLIQNVEKTTIPINGSSEDHEITPSKPVNEENTGLSYLQILALAGDAISHTGDIAGPITFVANLATNNTLPRWGKAVVQCGATLFGGSCSIANVRTCRDAILSNNASMRR